MNDDAISSLIRALADRGGTRGLLQKLGFTRPLRELPASQVTLPGARRVTWTRRSILRAYVVDWRRPCVPSDLPALARSLRRHDVVAHHLLVMNEPGRRRVTLAMSAPGAPLCHAVLEPRTIRLSDIELVAELVRCGGEADVSAAVRMTAALGRARLGHRFFRDIVAVRDMVARSWTGVPADAVPERDALALLLLSRLMFLYFLQRRGVLDGDLRFMPELLAGTLGRSRRCSFFRGALRTLFFGVLNRRPEERTAAARALGELPYLNGGLFEAHRLETEHDRLDLPDGVMARVFGNLLEKYRFTSNDAADQAVDAEQGAEVDPEMLGRIFEGLMSGERRGRTGTFYTPAEVVDRVVRHALSLHLARRLDLPGNVARQIVNGEGDVVVSRDVLRQTVRTAANLRVLDPACGSGAFLLGVMARLSRLRLQGTPEPDASLAVRGDIVARSLHGVDLLDDAALICSLRLWLGLLPAAHDREVTPLPNLDRRIRQGDALVDPLDLGIAINGRALDSTAPPGLRRLIADVEPASAAYLRAGPAEKPALRARLNSLERELALTWLEALDGRMQWERRELAARAADLDLFGEPMPHAASAARQLVAAERRAAELQGFRGDIGGSKRLPFFSFRVHFAEAADGFDLILSNPPWVRAHHWPPTVRQLLRQRFHVCARAGWPAGEKLAGLTTGAAGQVDLSLLFLERSLRLLSDHGTLAMLLPAKLMRSLYAGGARDLVLAQAELVAIEDHSLDHRAVFDADAFTSVLIMHSRPDNHRGADEAGGAALDSSRSNSNVSVALRRAGGHTLEFDVPHAELPLVRGDTQAPWLLVPPACREVLRAMQRTGTTFGAATTIRRGIMTGSNDVLIVRDAEPKLGDLARVRTEGYYRAATDQGRNAYTAYVEASALRPVLRGTDVTPWRVAIDRHVLWVPCNGGGPAPTPPRLARYLRRHRGRLKQTDDRLGTLQRLSPLSLGHKVVWADLASDLRAAAVPATTRSFVGTQVPVLPLNTVYFIATSSADESMLLSAYLNSLPVRLFARAIAERAKDAHFRFFAWTIAVLPLPVDWRTNGCAEQLTAIAHRAHARGGCTPSERATLDEIAAASYGIGPGQLGALREFDTWLRTGSAGNSGTQPERRTDANGIAHEPAA
ncbi:MAG TPA: hypothetical protein VK929_06515 [Longimicrobiales bacterium]|nr:hypothetical protein [Longimicrobiales bacterium]